MKHSMKSILAILLSIIAVLTIGLDASAQIEGVTINVDLKKHPKTDKPILGRRTPGAYFTCTISLSSGLQIPYVDKSEICLYEVCDEDDNPIASFSDEMDFVSSVLNSEERLVIKLYFEDFILVGTV